MAELCKEATAFLSSFGWCRSIRECYLCNGIGPVFGVFYFEIDTEGPDVDDAVWVIVSDIPPAIVPSQESTTADEAVRDYIYSMREWSAAVLAGEPIDELIPVLGRNSLKPNSLTPIEPTTEHAQMLSSRLAFIEREILPYFEPEE